MEQVLVEVLEHFGIELFAEVQVQLPLHSFLLLQNHFAKNFQLFEEKRGRAFLSFEKLLHCLNRGQQVPEVVLRIGLELADDVFLSLLLLLSLQYFPQMLVHSLDGQELLAFLLRALGSPRLLGVLHCLGLFLLLEGKSRRLFLYLEVVLVYVVVDELHFEQSLEEQSVFHEAAFVCQQM